MPFPRMLPARNRLRPLLLVALACISSACATTGRRIVDPRATALEPTPREDQVGVASFYSRAHHGRRTASGERFDMHAMTAAHRTLAFGTRVRVTNLENGKDVVVRINDRGPFRRSRVIDVSYAAARELGLVRKGVARVRIERL